MASLFKPRANLIARSATLALVLLAAGLSAGIVVYRDSSWFMLQGLEQPQPVPFSHQHHVAGLGLDCGYCHGVRHDTATMPMPQATVCMHCHSQVWTESEMLAPIREAAASGTSIVWTRVYRLPDHVFFDHSVHLSAGVGCEQCHGDMGQQRLTSPAEALQMQWCLGCHRHPDRAGVPSERASDPAQGRAAEITNCSACHR